MKKVPVRKMKLIALIIAIVFANQACNKEDGKEDPSDTFVSLSLNFNDKKQEIHSFGASDAWSLQFT